MRRRRLLLLVAPAALAATLALWLSFSFGDHDVSAQPQVPVHLDILSAGVEEVPPIDPENVPGRGVALRIELAGAPTCDASTGFLAYGFLVDSDADPATGTTDVAFEPLGVDARLSAECDPATGEFVSPLGVVAVTTDAASGSTTIEILTTVGLLPAIKFNWIAFAHENTSFTRLPKEPSYGAWGTHEISLY